MPPPYELTENDFFQGLFAALALRGVRKVSIRTDSFDPVIKRVYDEFDARAASMNVELDFAVAPDPVHGDSLVIKDALAASAKAEVISYDNPEYQDVEIRLGPIDASRLIDRRFPDLRGAFESIAATFVDQYDASPRHR